MGTSHIYWLVPTSGYASFAMKKEDRTRVAMLHGRYSLERTPNPILSENPEDARGAYLIKLPSAAQLDKKREEKELAESNAQAALHNTAIGLQTRIQVDALKSEHARLTRELRELELEVSPNPFARERALAAFDSSPGHVPMPKHGVKHTLQHFPRIRSKPQYTAYIKNNKGL